MAQLLKIPTSTLSDILHRIITRKRQSHKIKKLRKIGIDEISYCKGRKYATIVYDLERNRRIHRSWVLKDEFEQFWEFTDQESAGEFFDGWRPRYS